MCLKRRRTSRSRSISSNTRSVATHVNDGSGKGAASTKLWMSYGQNDEEMFPGVVVIVLLLWAAQSEFSASNTPAIEAPAVVSRERRVILFMLPPTSVRSTVDVEYFSADLACVREVQDGVGDIIHVRKLSHRLQRPEKIFRIVLVHRCVHDSWGYRVESDPVLGIFDGQALDRRVQPALGDHRNRRVHSCDRLIGERGGDAHEGAGPLFEHLCHGKLGDVEKAQEVRRHQGVEVFSCELGKRPSGEYSRVCHQKIDASELLQGRCDNLGGRFIFPDVTIDED